jgi:ABC-type nickel/cobalt efflux system permease component RcnA
VGRTGLGKTIGLIAAIFAASCFVGFAHAQSSLGIGTNDAMPASTGLFAHQLLWINQQQQAFYRALAEAMKAMREDDSKLWLLVGLSFAYGIFHAAGPGHGKAVISSYMVANEVALKRGILLSFLSALLQAITAIVVMLLAYFVLRGTSVSMTDAAWFLEISSYVFVTGFGAWLLWKKAGPAVLRLFGKRPTHSLSAAHADHSHCNHGHLQHHTHDSHDHHHHGIEVCSSCGHSHAPDPALISGDRFDWRTAWTAVAAVGIRPCSGALIVLSFALLNGLWVGGILSVLAMALGTAITVSILATLAVTAKNWAVYFAGDGRMGNRIHSAIEIGGAAFIFLFGLLLLSASLTA